MKNWGQIPNGDTTAPFSFVLMKIVQEYVQVFIFTIVEAIRSTFLWYSRLIAIYSAWLEIFPLQKLQEKI